MVYNFGSNRNRYSIIVTLGQVKKWLSVSDKKKTLIVIEQGWVGY